jgi:WhiB family redox-sensing transcriptional regulator
VKVWQTTPCAGDPTAFPRAPKPAGSGSRWHVCCGTCPVRERQDFARSHHEYGYWGGESEEDRHLAGFTVSAPIGIRARNG